VAPSPLTNALTLRMGYTYNMNPIPDSRTAFNVASPTILEHTVYAGFSYNVTECFMLSLAYAHGFENTVQGPYITPLGTLPGASIKSDVWADTVMIGATVKF
jgi:long-chain fatty acid transport protein